MFLLLSKFHIYLHIDLYCVFVLATGGPSHTFLRYTQCSSSFFYFQLLSYLPRLPHTSTSTFYCSQCGTLVLLFRQMWLFYWARCNSPDIYPSRYRYSNASLLHSQHQKRRTSRRRFLPRHRGVVKSSRQGPLAHNIHNVRHAMKCGSTMRAPRGA